MTGDDVFRTLMDLDLILQDGDKMIALKLMLSGASPDDPNLIRFNDMILDFKFKIERLTIASQKQLGL